MSWAPPRYEPKSNEVEPKEWTRSQGTTAALYFALNQNRKQEYAEQEEAKKASMIKAHVATKVVSEQEMDSF